METVLIWQLILLLILVLAIAVPIVALADIVRSNFKGSNDKLIWVLAVLFLNPLGSVLYFILGKEQKIKNPEETMDFYAKDV